MRWTRPTTLWRRFKQKWFAKNYRQIRRSFALIPRHMTHTNTIIWLEYVFWQWDIIRHRLDKYDWLSSRFKKHYVRNRETLERFNSYD